MKNQMTITKLQPLTDHELSSIGGGFLPFAILVTVILSAVSNFGDIREGIVDGFNGKPRH
jgi:hypothetical protein